MAAQTGLCQTWSETDDPFSRITARMSMFYSRAAGGKLVDATPEVNNSLQEELNRVDQRFGATGKDMTKFPEFKFSGKDKA